MDKRAARGEWKLPMVSYGMRDFRLEVVASGLMHRFAPPFVDDHDLTTCTITRYQVGSGCFNFQDSTDNAEATCTFIQLNQNVPRIAFTRVEWSWGGVVS